jgi:hypothetical protein
LVEELIRRYKATMEHIAFILCAEREGNLITTNHYFSENLEKARKDRLYNAIHHKSAPNTWEGFGEKGKVVVEMDKLLSAAGIGNLEHTVQDIHDILKSYYHVARKRFVDNVCMQGTDYYLVSGPKSPLRVLSPMFIGNLTSDQLQAIAVEDSTSIQRRKELLNQIESLKEGRRILATA